MDEAQIKEIAAKYGYGIDIKPRKRSASTDTFNVIYAYNDTTRRSLGPLTTVAALSEDELRTRIAAKFPGLPAPRAEKDCELLGVASGDQARKVAIGGKEE